MRSRDDCGGGENDDARKREESLQSIALALEWSHPKRKWDK